MARGITSGLNTEVTASELEPIFLIDLEFDSGALYFWNGVRPLTYNSNEYIGGGNLINISPIVETNDIRAVGVNLAMSGLPASLISIALTEAYQGQPVKIRFAALSSGAIVADPYLIFDGRMDVLSIDDMADGATINISAESRMIDLSVHACTAIHRKTKRLTTLTIPGWIMCQSFRTQPFSGGGNAAQRRLGTTS